MAATFEKLFQSRGDLWRVGCGAALQGRSGGSSAVWAEAVRAPDTPGGSGRAMATPARDAPDASAAAAGDVTPATARREQGEGHVPRVPWTCDAGDKGKGKGMAKGRSGGKGTGTGARGCADAAATGLPMGSAAGGAFAESEHNGESACLARRGADDATRKAAEALRKVVQKGTAAGQPGAHHYTQGMLITMQHGLDMKEGSHRPRKNDLKQQKGTDHLVVKAMMAGDVHLSRSEAARVLRALAAQLEEAVVAAPSPDKPSSRKRQAAPLPVQPAFALIYRSPGACINSHEARVKSRKRCKPVAAGVSTQSVADSLAD